MKKLFLFFNLACSVLLITAQVDIDKPIILSGASDNDRAITNLALPVNGTDAANKDYVDAQSGGGAAHVIGELFGGGVVYQVYRDANGDERGFIVDLADKSSGRSWSATEAVVPAPGAQSAWNGLVNSNASQTQNNNSAAGDCRNSTSGGNTDWYLPALTELKVIWDNLNIINRVLSTAGGGAAEMMPEWYWTSSEYYDSNQAARIHFGNGTITDYQPKSSNHRVRCVRAF